MLNATQTPPFCMRVIYKLLLYTAVTGRPLFLLLYLCELLLHMPHLYILLLEILFFFNSPLNFFEEYYKKSSTYLLTFKQPSHWQFTANI